MNILERIWSSLIGMFYTPPAHSTVNHDGIAPPAHHLYTVVTFKYKPSESDRVFGVVGMWGIWNNIMVGSDKDMATMTFKDARTLAFWEQEAHKYGLSFGTPTGEIWNVPLTETHTNERKAMDQCW